MSTIERVAVSQRTWSRAESAAAPGCWRRAVPLAGNDHLAECGRHSFEQLKNTGHPGLKTRRHCVSIIDHMRALKTTFWRKSDRFLALLGTCRGAVPHRVPQFE